MQTEKLPARLGKSPLLSTVFELRFEPANAATADLLPGLLYGSLRQTYERAETLPAASIPLAIRERDPNLRYQAVHRLVGKEYQIAVAHRAVTLTVLGKYPGWQDFLGRIRELLDAVQNTQLLTRLERFSFRYVNLLSVPAGRHPLDALRIKLTLRDQTPGAAGMLIRMELRDRGFVNIVQVGADASAQLPDGSKRSGLMIDIDTVRVLTGNLDPALLEDGHATTKTAFFSLLCQNTLDGLEPVWEE